MLRIGEYGGVHQAGQETAQASHAPAPSSSSLPPAGSVRQLAKLRARLKLAIAQFVGYRGEYVNYVKKALDLEGVCKSR